MDSIPREFLNDNVDMFKYRGAVSITPVGMIDDLATVAYCGPQSVIANALVNAEINIKKLEFNQSKCVKLHISKENRKPCADGSTKDSKCVFLEVQDFEMKEAPTEKYIGDIISNDGSNDANIAKRRSIGIGATSDI